MNWRLTRATHRPRFSLPSCCLPRVLGSNGTLGVARLAYRSSRVTWGFYVQVAAAYRNASSSTGAASGPAGPGGMGEEPEVGVHVRVCVYVCVRTCAGASVLCVVQLGQWGHAVPRTQLVAWERSQRCVGAYVCAHTYVCACVRPCVCMPLCMEGGMREVLRWILGP